MTTVNERVTAPTGPERPGGQGLDANQEESGNRAIYLLLSDPTVGPQTDFVATWRTAPSSSRGNDAYEVWAARGMVRFQRFAGNGSYEYRVVQQAGQNPVEQQDPRALATIDDELEAARRSGRPTDDPDKAYIEPEHLTYPLAYERIAQLFDSPNAPDLVINPKTYAFGRQPGQHGALDVIQSRAPLCFSGAGVHAGVTDEVARHIDIAPTIAKLLGWPAIAGRDATGKPSNEVYFRRQDGRVLDDVVEGAASAERCYIIHMDGVSNSELRQRLDEPDSIPNLKRLIGRGLLFRYGSIVNFPSITWPSHNAIGTSCWCGHHDIVNPTYYLRDKRKVITPQGQQFDSARYLGDEVETLYEACHRVYGSWQSMEGALTAAIHEPCTRGADHSVLERRVVGNKERLKQLTQECAPDISERWQDEGHRTAFNESVVDNRGVAQVMELFTGEGHPPPRFVFHEFTLTDGVGHDFGPHSDHERTALDETDRRIGRILHMLEERGLFDSTLFVITADHGMAATEVELAADQGALLPQEGMKAISTMPLVYLIDMAVEIEHARDGRTATITVMANDLDETGERPFVEGATVTVSAHGNVLSEATTNGGGVAGVPLPVELPPEDVVLTVHHDDYNPRHLRLDGSNVVIDLRELLYQDKQ
jgi:hypothetical protein